MQLQEFWILSYIADVTIFLWNVDSYNMMFEHLVEKL